MISPNVSDGLTTCIRRPGGLGLGLGWVGGIGVGGWGVGDGCMERARRAQRVARTRCQTCTSCPDGGSPPNAQNQHGVMQGGARCSATGAHHSRLWHVPRRERPGSAQHKRHRFDRERSQGKEQNARPTQPLPIPTRPCPLASRISKDRLFSYVAHPPSPFWYDSTTFTQSNRRSAGMGGPTSLESICGQGGGAHRRWHVGRVQRGPVLKGVEGIAVRPGRSARHAAAKARPCTCTHVCTAGARAPAPA